MSVEVGEAYCDSGAREEGQCQDGNGLHGCAVLSCLFSDLRCSRRHLEIQQVISSALLGDLARALGELNIELVVAQGDEIEDLTSGAVSVESEVRCVMSHTAFD